MAARDTKQQATRTKVGGTAASSSSRNTSDPTLEGSLPRLPDGEPLHITRGFLLSTLLRTDTDLYGRWDYLTDCWHDGKLPDVPIPRLDFLMAPDTATWKMLTESLNAIPEHGGIGWQGWSGSEYFHYFVEWLLYGFHHAGQPEPLREPQGCAGANDRLREVFDLALWQTHPYDYLGELLAQNAYGKGQGFFPTPHTICELMTRLTLPEGKDARTLTVCDPCVGTGRLLLHASNHSLRLYGMEIDGLLCQATLVNGYLFAPWLVKPLPYLDGVQYDAHASGALSDAMAAQAQPHQQEVLQGTEHDAGEQYRFEPIKKRLHKVSKQDGAGDEPRQGTLF